MMEIKPKVLTDKYEVGKLLGQGYFAKVYLGKSVLTGRSVAIKVIDKKKMFALGKTLRLDLRNQAKREISIMRTIKHPNVVELYEVIATKDRICLVMEYCRGGDLCTKTTKVKLSEKLALKYFCQLINALEFCHSRGVYHRDIKLDNMLLDDNDDLKVSDFGLSTFADCTRQDGLFHTGCGTRGYVSPEVLCYKGYDGAKADIWSCGVVLFMLLTNSKPFYKHNEFEMDRNIKKGKYECPTGFPPEAKSLLAKMLEPNPETRITISNIKESPWFKKHLFSKVREPSFMGAGSSSENPEPPQLAKLNAFGILGLSTGFNLAGRFGDFSKKKESSFTSQIPVSEIISKLNEVAKCLKLKIKKQREGLFRLEGSTEGLKGIVSINAEIFQVMETFHLVEMKKCSGDTMEYQKLVEDDLRPALADIVWVWQGDKEKKEQGDLEDE